MNDELQWKLSVRPSEDAGITGRAAYATGMVTRNLSDATSQQLLPFEQ